MAAIRTYGIPNMIEVREIFYFNDGVGKLPITFSGGITDPKHNIPATYSTANEVEQIIIETSPLFGKKVFRYMPNGQVVSTTTFGAKNPTPSKVEEKAAKLKDKTKTYENVETIGQATEILLELGAKADELNGPDAIVSAMVKLKVAFPNLKF